MAPKTLRETLLLATPWAALGVALSAAVAQLFRQFSSLPFAGSLVVAPLLAIMLFIKTRRRKSWNAAVPKRSLALALLVSALAIEFVGVVGETWSLAWLSIPIGIVALAHWTGQPDARIAILSIGCIPLPTTLFLQTSPAIESFFAGVAATLASIIIPQIETAGPLIRIANDTLALRSVDNGLHVAWIAGLMVYTGGQIEARAARGLALLFLRVPAIAFAVQLGATLIAIAFLWAGAPDMGESWLRQGVWISVSIAGFLWLSRRRLSVPDRPQEPSTTQSDDLP